MTPQQVEILVRGKGSDFAARLRLQYQEENGDTRTFEANVLWDDFGKYCDVAGINKFAASAQEPNDAVLYDSRTVSTELLRRFGFIDVTKDWGPGRVRIVDVAEAAGVIEECRIEGYQRTDVSPPNDSGKITIVFERAI